MDLSKAKWRKAKASGSNGGGCVEVATLGNAGVGIRDSKRPEGGALVVSSETWASFMADIKAGEFHLPA